MTDIGFSREQLRQYMANKMAEFQNVRDEVWKAEVEEYFLKAEAFTAECRIAEAEGALNELIAHMETSKAISRQNLEQILMSYSKFFATLKSAKEEVLHLKESKINQKDLYMNDVSDSGSALKNQIELQKAEKAYEGFLDFLKDKKIITTEEHARRINEGKASKNKEKNKPNRMRRFHDNFNHSMKEAKSNVDRAVREFKSDTNIDISKVEKIKELTLQIEKTVESQYKNLDSTREEYDQTKSKYKKSEHQLDSKVQQSINEIEMLMNAVESEAGKREIISQKIDINSIKQTENNPEKQLEHIQLFQQQEDQNIDSKSQEIDPLIYSTGEDFLSTVKDDMSYNCKIVLDQSVANLYEIFASDFGSENVVIDRRGEDRRNQTDRRASEEPNYFNDKRSDADGRRKGDRRNNNHIYVSEQSLKEFFS